LLESARAKILQAEATIEEARRQMERLEQLGKLSGSKAVSQYDLDSAKANLARALADKAAAEASVSQAKAALEVNETDLSKTSIYSPIDGVVLTRSVEPGQTVAASLQAPVLFTIAEDLREMELHVDVDEADVGKVKEGQKATFYVDAYPERTFPARISQVRYGAKTVDGVVTYETVLNADNSDLSLRPGMTATADIVVEEIEDTVLIPNAALRFSPPSSEKSGRSGGGILGKIFFRPPRGPEKERRDTGGGKSRQQVWTLEAGKPVALPVTIGVSDGAMTQVLEGVEPGTALIVDAAEAKG
jgi:HlyD family secretion protein